MLGVLPGIIGSIQALETIKVILGLGDALIGRILSVDTTEMEFRTFNLRLIRQIQSHGRTVTALSFAISTVFALLGSKITERSHAT